jgi:RNA polymerase sigma-70 factor (ECF subfamily)
MPRVGQADTYALVERARRGEARARSELLESLRARLVLWCAARMSADLRAKADPEDLAQEIVLAVHRDLDAFEGEGRRRFYAWLFTLAENRVRDLADHFAAAKRQAVPLPRRDDTTPATAASRRESVVLLRGAIERLPEDHRSVVRLRRLEELEFDEIATALGRSENAVRILYCRALKGLRAEMGAAG